MANRQSVCGDHPAAIEGRYSYDNPPVPGNHVISPNGRIYLVLNVNANRECFCQRVNDAICMTFQANDLRFYR